VVESRWYACYTRPRHEKQVERVLQGRAVESFLPLVHRMRQWKDRRTVVAFAMYPGYVFARFSPDRAHDVLSVPGVVGVIRNNGRPVPIPDEEMENLRRFSEALASGDGHSEMVSLPDVGGRVCIGSGPFEGLHGIVVERLGRRRFIVGLHLLGRGMEVDFPAEVLELVP
jgi:transcription antitermination factor NusG